MDNLTTFVTGRWWYMGIYSDFTCQLHQRGSNIIKCIKRPITPGLLECIKRR